MRMRPERSAVLFDIDGTLIDSTAVVEHVWSRVAAAFGVPREPVLAVCHGKRDADVAAEFFPEPVRAEVLAEVARLELAAADAVVAVPGAANVLGQLDPRRWAAVTSGGRELMTGRLRAAGLPLPCTLICAEDVSRGKPDPEGYLAAARELVVEPADCVVVEDSPPGVAAGIAAGALVAAVTTTHPREALGGAHVVLPELSAVLGLL
ncbi:HAD-IA family hydrolase [Saccharopolyspora gregorii]|uniref:HAD family hydrolase n=1 Tax=Saccharopolyspora gregorii TaxID=33914 RepID=A0ABP6RUQ4_9PSEU